MTNSFGNPAVPDTAGLALLSDSAAIARFGAQRDPESFRVIAERYHAMVYATCLRILGSESDAEDATQETFLKLARAVRSIRGNVAAWLHACARGTSIDMVRSRTARERTEQAASQRSVSRLDQAPWSDLEPLLDEALESLPEKERSAVIGHFLCHRTCKDLAQDAGVSVGTMSRRIDSGLSKLHTRLVAAGCALSIPALSASLIGMCQSTSAPPTLALSLSKIGLTGSILAAPGTTLISGVGAKVAAALVLTSAIGASLVMLPGNNGPAPTSAVAGAMQPVPRPSKALLPMNLVQHTLDGVPQSDLVVVISSDLITMHAPEDRSFSAPVGRLSILSTAGTQNAQTLLLRIDQFDPASPLSGKQGEQFEARCRVDGEQLSLSFTLANESRPTTWLARRAPDLSKSAPSEQPDPKSAALAATDPIMGVWRSVDAWQLQLQPDEIVLTAKESGQVLQRFKIFSWEEADGFSSLQTMCVFNIMERAAIGKRVKMLLRKDADTIQVALHEPVSDKADTAPAGFQPRRGDQVLVFTWEVTR